MFVSPLLPLPLRPKDNYLTFRCCGFLDWEVGKSETCHWIVSIHLRISEQHSRVRATEVWAAIWYERSLCSSFEECPSHMFNDQSIIFSYLVSVPSLLEARTRLLLSPCLLSHAFLTLELAFLWPDRWHFSSISRNLASTRWASTRPVPVYRCATTEVLSTNKQYGTKLVSLMFYMSKPRCTPGKTQCFTENPNQQATQTLLFH